MKNWTKVNNNNIVQEVIVFEDGITPTAELPENWQWVCDDDSVKNNAAIGYSYSSEYSGFIAPQPFNSWSLNTDTCSWEPPTPCPLDDKKYDWNEETQTWDVDNS